MVSGHTIGQITTSRWCQSIQRCLLLSSTTSPPLPFMVLHTLILFSCLLHSNIPQSWCTHSYVIHLLPSPYLPTRQYTTPIHAHILFFKSNTSPSPHLLLIPTLPSLIPPLHPFIYSSPSASSSPPFSSSYPLPSLPLPPPPPLFFLLPIPCLRLSLIGTLLRSKHLGRVRCCK